MWEEKKTHTFFKKKIIKKLLMGQILLIYLDPFAGFGGLKLTPTPMFFYMAKVV